MGWPRFYLSFSNKTLETINPFGKLERNNVHIVYNVISPDMAYEKFHDLSVCNHGRDWRCSTSSTSTLTCTILSRSNRYFILHYQYCVIQNIIITIHDSFIITKATKNHATHNNTWFYHGSPPLGYDHTYLLLILLFFIKNLMLGTLHKKVHL